MADCDRALQINPKHGWTWFQRGRLDVSAKRDSDAEADFRSAVVNGGAPAYAYIDLSETQVRLGKYSEAVASASTYVTKYPEFAVGYVVRAEAEAKLGQGDAAAKDANRALQLTKPSDSDEPKTIERAKAVLAGLNEKPAH